MLCGRKASIFSLVLNLIYALLWSAVGIATPIMGPTIYRPFSRWWHITVLEVIGVGLTIYFMATVSLIILHSIGCNKITRVKLLRYDVKN